ncbi:MAG: ATP-binding protein [Corynebacterium variabile]|uniref:ATP-binding protein n=1 Tax=Corynebacterium variabile TaxID=1727 RepID=UPI003F982DE8
MAFTVQGDGEPAGGIDTTLGDSTSLVITTNLEFARWGAVFGDDTMAAAVIDRIVHHGRLVLFTGSSYRVTHSLMT